ncbi:MAG: hypothetical protein RL685_5070 [Pseudomonadota bacterium]
MRSRRAWVEATAVRKLLLFPGRGALIRAPHFAESPDVDFFGREDKTGIVALRRQASCATAAC